MKGLATKEIVSMQSLDTERRVLCVGVSLSILSSLLFPSHSFVNSSLSLISFEVFFFLWLWLSLLSVINWLTGSHHLLNLILFSWYWNCHF